MEKSDHAGEHAIPIELLRDADVLGRYIAECATKWIAGTSADIRPEALAIVLEEVAASLVNRAALLRSRGVRQ